VLKIKVRKINKIIIHCTATPPHLDIGVEDVDRWHKQKGWKGIGYHYLIDLRGHIYRGREDNEIGAHVKGHNRNSIGVVYVGGVDANGEQKDTRTDDQKLALRGLIDNLNRRYPDATVHGHNEFTNNKACPSFNVKYEL